MPEDKPNVILITADQMRGDCLSADGHPVVDTPHLDHLASNGTRFRCAYTAVPSCIPARATLMTGLSQWHTGVLGMGRGQGGFPNDFPHTLAGDLADSGYQTHLVGKGHFNPQRASMGFQSRELDESGRLRQNGQRDEYRQWFDREKKRDISPDDHGVDWNSWIGRPWHTEEHLHPTAWTMTRSLHFLANRDFTRPFFLNISFARPHSPYVPPRSFFEMYDRQKTPKPYVGDWAHMHDRPNEAANINAWRGKQSAFRIRRARAGYYGEISFIDSQIGRLRNWLSRHQPETARNVWILFTSDHGDMVGDHHLWRKTYAYEGSARIPMIVSPPPRLRRCLPVSDKPVELRDIMPTILDAADVEPPSYLDGRSLLPLMRGEQTEWRPYIHGEHSACYSREQEMHYVTDGKRKYIWLPLIDTEQFFDLEEDPGELNDLSDQPERADEFRLWRGRLIQELEARECGWTKDGDLHSPEDGQPLVSPWRNVRYTG